MTGAELALTVVMTIANIYFLIISTRLYVICFFARRYERKLREYRPNKDLLAKRPFVSIMIPTYNEENVIDRVLRACVSLDYDNYEVVVVDDSTDGTVRILERWARHPRVKVIHREDRRGWKGGALDEGLKHLDPRSEFVLVFDADFIPPKDVIQRLLVRFVDEKIVAVQGYHMAKLNSDENAVTRASRTHMSVGFAVDYAGRFAMGGAPPLCGSVMMIRKRALEELGGFGSSITEDYDLSLRLYSRGYKVFYDKSTKALCECPSSLGQILRQTCRWIEGRVRDLRRRLALVLRSKELPLRRKLDIILDGLYSLSPFMFLLWLVAATAFVVLKSPPNITVLVLILKFLLPSSLALFIPMPVAAVQIPILGLRSPWVAIPYTIYVTACFPIAQFMALKEEGEDGTLRWILSFLFVMWLACPFYMKACFKGLLTNRSYFCRTYKTGRITVLLEKLPSVEPLREPSFEPLAGGDLFTCFSLGNFTNFLTWNWAF